jgi:hypothetical protein
MEYTFLLDAYLTVTVNDKVFNIYILICLEALRDGNPTVEPNTLAVITAWTPSLEEFEDISRVQLINELPTALSNTSLIGGSTVFARFQGDSFGFISHSKDSINPLDQNTEGVIIVDIDLENQYLKRKSTSDHAPAVLINCTPFLYLDDQKNQLFEEAIEKYINHGDDAFVLSSLDNPLWKKIYSITKTKRSNGIFRDDELKSALSCLVLNPLSNVRSFRRNNIERAIDLISKLIRKYPKLISEVTNSLTSLSSSLNKYSNPEPVKKELSYDDKPFLNRDKLFEDANKFFRNTESKILLIKGVRGIGKTHFVHQLFKRVLPGFKWTRIDLLITPGTGTYRFLNQLNFYLGMVIPVQEIEESISSNDCTKVSETMLATYDTMHNACLVIHNWQNVLTGSGEFKEKGIDDFFRVAASRDSYTGNKIIIISTRSFRKENYTEQLKVYPLEVNYIQEMLDYYMRLNKGTFSITDSYKIAPLLHGHPFSVMIAAQQSSEEQVNKLLVDQEALWRFRESVVRYLLEGISLSDDQRKIIQILSLMNLPVNIDVIYQLFKNDPTLILNELVGMFLININEQGLYSIHPLLQRFFSDQIDSVQKTLLHTEIANILENNSASGNESPEIIGEIVYHFASALDLKKSLEYKNHYSSELRPVALRLFKTHNYKEALKYYQALSSMHNDIDIEYRLAVCLVNLKKWSDAAYHFEKALSFDEDAWWVYSGYANALVSVSRDNRREAESLALKADEIAKRLGIKVLERARIKSILGKVRQYDGDYQTAEKLFLESINENPGHIQAYKLLVKLYTKQHRYDEAKEIVKNGISRNPYNELLASLMQNLNQEREEGSEDEFYLDEEGSDTESEEM